MPATAQIPGFVSQREFAQAMDWYHADERADESIIDPVSQDLYSSGKQKGRKCEYLVAHRFRRMGYRAQVLKGQEGCDLLVNIKNRWVNVEVKAAQFRGSRQYSFHRIKPDNFDLIVLVFVGMDYTTIQIGGATAKDFISTWATWVDSYNSYSIGFSRNRRHSKACGRDDIWFPFTKSNISKVI